MVVRFDRVVVPPPPEVALLDPLAAHALDRRSPVPLYRQLEQALRAHVVDAGLAPGDALPTEMELVAAFGVSRSTAREALARLQRDGLIERRRARGTRVAARPFVEPFAWPDSYVLRLLARGHDVRSRPLTVAATSAPPRRVADALELDDGEPVHAIRRVVWVDGVPQNVAVAYLRSRLVPGFRSGDLVPEGAGQSTYHLLRARYGVALTSADIDVEPHRLTADEAARLGRRQGAAALRRIRVVRTVGDRPLLYERAVFANGFRLTFTAPLDPTPSPNPTPGGPA
jgi:GntR family transcriptional regulator